MTARRLDQRRIRWRGKLGFPPTPRAHGTSSAVLGRRVVQFLLQNPHQAAAVRAERGHRPLLGAAQFGHRCVALGVVAPVRVRDDLPAAPVARDRALDVEDLEHRLDPAHAEIHDRHQLTNRATLVSRIRELAQHCRHPLAVRERLLDEEVLDPAVLAASEQDDVGVLDAAAGAPDLLVVGDDRTRRLVVHDEAQVGLVVSHPERAGGDDRLDLVAEQPVLGGDAVLGLVLAAVRHRGDPPGAQERGDLLGVALGERVDDPRSVHTRKVLRQPGESLGRPRQFEDLQAQARARAAARDRSAAPRLAGFTELRDHVGHDPVVGGRGRAEHRHSGRERVEHVLDPPVVGAEVVPPVRDAMGLVDHEQADRRGEQRQHLLAEAGVVEPLGADQQQVDRPGGQPVADVVPLVAVGAVDRVRPQPEALGGGDLVAHQRQQRADDQRGSGARLPQQRGRDEVHRGLAPAGPLHAQHAGPVDDYVLDRLELVRSESGVRIVGENS